MKILAIAPTSKRLGVAVFEKTELIYFAVATVKSNKIALSLQIKISQTVRNLITEFEPDLVVIKTLNKQQKKSTRLRLAVRQIRYETRTAGIKTEEIPFEAVKKLLCDDNKPTKTNAFPTLANFYPELRRFLHQPNKWQKEYYDALLLAAATGFTAKMIVSNESRIKKLQ